MVAYSVLDLSPVAEGEEPADAFRHSAELARHAEGWGYTRYWLAEHHNMPGIASAATAVVIAHVAAATRDIRVGSGGVMLPNHAPLVVAEQFGTLESLYPGRIDLGLGRAPGTDMATARALRRDLESSADRFPQDVVELIGYFEPATAERRVRAVPGTGLRVPVWLLGSSLFSAQLAAMLGLPFAFASHFAPEHLADALAIYRARFEASDRLHAPYAMVGVGVYAAETDEAARRLFTSAQQQFLRLRRGNPGKVPAPVDDIASVADPMEIASVNHTLRHAFVGSRATVREGLARFLDIHRPDEVMVAGQFFDQQARVASYGIAAEILRDLGATRRA